MNTSGFYSFPHVKFLGQPLPLNSFRFSPRSSCFACGDTRRSWNLTSTHSMSHLQDLSSSFADDHARGHGVTGRHAGHDGSVRETEVVDSIDLQLAVYHGHRISSHLGSG